MMMLVLCLQTVSALQTQLELMQEDLERYVVRIIIDTGSWLNCTIHLIVLVSSFKCTHTCTYVCRYYTCIHSYIITNTCTLTHVLCHVRLHSLSLSLFLSFSCALPPPPNTSTVSRSLMNGNSLI